MAIFTRNNGGSGVKKNQRTRIKKGEKKESEKINDWGGRTSFRFSGVHGEPLRKFYRNLGIGGKSSKGQT